MTDPLAHFMHSGIAEKILTALGLLVLYHVGQALYNVYLHPIAGFPGPKIAAATWWYYFYWTFVKSGQFSDKLEQVHKQYGPIVRIAPNEVHINDPTYYDSLYNSNPNLHKAVYQLDNLQNTASSDLHKKRRRPFEPFFTRAAILRLEPLIHEALGKLCAHLQSSRRSKKAADASVLVRATVTDIISDHCFGQSYCFLDNLDFSTSFFKQQNAAVFSTLPLVREIAITSWILHSMKNLPSWMMPDLAIVKLEKQVQASLDSTGRGKKHDRDTIFEAFRRSDLPPAEKSDRIQLDSGMLLVTAGFETTGSTISAAIYHVIANPSIHSHLKNELRSAWSDPDSVPSWSALEKLPYLKAVLQESLRMSLGVLSRLSRVNHKETMQYNEWTIPKGVEISMSQRFIHYNPDLFPEPTVFRPERWLEGEQSRVLERHLVPFSKGSRACIGLQLAWAEMYLILATLFRRFDLQLYDTTRKEVDPKIDYFVPFPESGKGVRVLVK